MVQTNASDVSSSKLPEDWDQSAISSIPNFNTFRMGSDYSVKNRIV